MHMDSMLNFHHRSTVAAKGMGMEDENMAVGGQEQPDDGKKRSTR
jgi:hypothetical protein